MEVISWKNMPIFNEIILLLIRQNTIPYGQRHLELCFVINLTKDGNWAITRPPIFATGCVSFATTFSYQVASTCYSAPDKKE